MNSKNKVIALRPLQITINKIQTHVFTAQFGTVTSF